MPNSTNGIGTSKGIQQRPSATAEILSHYTIQAVHYSQRMAEKRIQSESSCNIVDVPVDIAR